MHYLCIRTKTKTKAKSDFRHRVSSLPRRIRSMWTRFLSCWMCKSPVIYHNLPVSHPPPPPQDTAAVDHTRDSSSDLVSVKITIFGDSHIGKTSFLKAFAGEEGGEFVETGENKVSKTLSVGGARISYCIWVVGGNESSHHRIPPPCKDSVALLFLFDLTSRRTLNSILGWYQDARRWNPNAIPVLVGTKFDEFVQLPIDLQWTVASQARGYAKAVNAPLFFSSATYNINVNKIFKFVTAKLFDLEWDLERNLNIGEPIIDF